MLPSAAASKWRFQALPIPSQIEWRVNISSSFEYIRFLTAAAYNFSLLFFIFSPVPHTRSPLKKYILWLSLWRGREKKPSLVFLVAEKRQYFSHPPSADPPFPPKKKPVGEGRESIPQKKLQKEIERIWEIGCFFLGKREWGNLLLSMFFNGVLTKLNYSLGYCVFLAETF